MIPALIGAGASLLGGLFDRSAQNKANAANRPASQVKQWEEAGINPRFGISQGQYIPVQATSIGDSFANAGNQIADGMRYEMEEKARQTELRKQNQQLQETIVKLKRGSQPGHLQRYGSKLPVPNRVPVESDPRFYPAKPVNSTKGTSYGPPRRFNNGNLVDDGGGKASSYLPAGGPESPIDELGGEQHPLNKGAGLQTTVTGAVAGNDMRFLGVPIYAAPWSSDMEVFEERVGETPVSWPIAAGLMAGDLAYSAYRWGDPISDYFAEKKKSDAARRARDRYAKPRTYDAGSNPPLRNHYGTPGARSGY